MAGLGGLVGTGSGMTKVIIPSVVFITSSQFSAKLIPWGTVPPPVSDILAAIPGMMGLVGSESSSANCTSISPLALKVMIGLLEFGPKSKVAFTKIVRLVGLMSNVS